MIKRPYIYIHSNADLSSGCTFKFQGRAGGPFDDYQAKIAASNICAECIFDFSQETFDVLTSTKRLMYPRDIVPSWMINKISNAYDYGDIFS